MKKSTTIIAAVLALLLFFVAIFFYIASENEKSEIENLQTLITSQASAVKEEIWIGSDDCKTTMGYNAVALCNGEPHDTSLWLDSGADAKTLSCFEYTTEKLGRPTSDARLIACEIKDAYGERNFDWDDANDTPGIQNSLYTILNEHVNK